MGMKKIMVVDDDKDQIFTLRHALETEDDEYDIISAESGVKCLQLLQNKQIPDLILLDIMMPEMSGWELYKRLQANQEWRNIPVVFLTARTDNDARKAGSFFGEDYIEKPFDIEDLKQRIDNVLAERQ